MPTPLWNHSEILDKSQPPDRFSGGLTRSQGQTAQFNQIIRRQPLTAREPDLAVFQAATIVELDGRHSAPQLIVEVLSPSNTSRMLAEKLVDYASLGVPDLWYIDQARTVEVFYLEQGKLQSQGTLSEGILTPGHFPTVQIAISEIWSD